MRERQFCRSALVGLITVFALACGKTATIEGDLTMQGPGGIQQAGTVKGAAKNVYLLRNPDSLMNAVNAICAAARSDAEKRIARVRHAEATADRFRRATSTSRSMRLQVALSDSTEKYRALAANERRLYEERSDNSYDVHALIRAATDTMVEASMEGHFRFTKVQPGRYGLYAEWPAMPQDHQFWSVVDVEAGDDKTQNLDQSTIATTKLRCR